MQSDEDTEDLYGSSYSRVYYSAWIRLCTAEKSDPAECCRIWYLFFQGLYNLVVIVMLNNTIEYDEYRFSERHDSVISAVRSFSVKLAGALNQGISALVLILSGIYVTSQGISELEIEVGKGTLTSESALSQANEAIAAVQPWQTFALRLGMVLIPVQTLLAAYLLIRKKYRISEEEYDRMVGEMKAGS